MSSASISRRSNDIGDVENSLHLIPNYVNPRGKYSVPDHLIETNVFSRIKSNDLVESQPEAVHFSGFKVGVKITRTFKVINKSTDCLRWHVLPPDTKYFKLYYDKQARYVPGMGMTVRVEFEADEWRYFYDCIRIHAPLDQTLIVPLHAYPVMTLKSPIPGYVTFPTTPLGTSTNYSLPLTNTAPVEFEYHVDIVKNHPSFTIHPLEGVLPPEDSTTIMIYFKPTEFATVRLELLIAISQFSCAPLLCSFVGHSAPGLLAKQETFPCLNGEIPYYLPPIMKRRATKTKGRPNERVTSAGTIVQVRDSVEHDGYRFPHDLNTVHAVSTVLGQKKGKLNAKQLREVMQTQGPSSKQAKEVMFDSRVRQGVVEERANQLRWQVTAGADPVTDAERDGVLASRELARAQYCVSRGDPVVEDEFARTGPLQETRRTRRLARTERLQVPSFDEYLNNPWPFKQAALERFVQAARKVIHRRRAAVRLVLIKSANETRPASPRQPSLNITHDSITKTFFPVYTSPGYKDELAPDALGIVDAPPIGVTMEEVVPFHDLKVPKQYRLLDYKRHDSCHTRGQYYTRGLSRPLKTGAQDEVIDIPAPLPASSLKDHSPPLDVAPMPASMFSDVTAGEHPMAILNPQPGFITYSENLRYSEVDVDFHLCPVPRYIRPEDGSSINSTQKQYVDSEDTIKGMMLWKKFPSQSLVCVSAAPHLAQVWTPKLCSLNDHVQLPRMGHEVAELEQQLWVEDSKADQGCLQPTQLSLTPEMVSEEFSTMSVESPDKVPRRIQSDIFPFGPKMPSNHHVLAKTGYEKRSVREQELSQLIKGNNDKLGEKFKSRLSSLNSMISDKRLNLEL